MKKILTILICIVLTSILVACASEENEEVPIEPTQSPQDITVQGQKPEKTTTIRQLGKVTDITDNTITIQLAEMDNSPVGGAPQGNKDNIANKKPENNSDNQSNKPENASGNENRPNIPNNQKPNLSESKDILEQITLTEERKTYTIEENNNVDLSKISIDDYISITLDEIENIISINVLG